MAKDAAEIVTVESIFSEFSRLEGPRSTVNRVHVLGDIVVISIMAFTGWGGGAKGDQRMGPE